MLRRSFLQILGAIVLGDWVLEDGILQRRRKIFPVTRDIRSLDDVLKECYLEGVKTMPDPAPLFGGARGLGKTDAWYAYGQQALYFDVSRPTTRGRLEIPPEAWPRVRRQLEIAAS